MGFGGLSIGHLLVVLVIILLVFGTKKLKNIGADLGDAVKGFRNAMASAEKDKDEEVEPPQIEQDAARRTAETGPGTDPGAVKSAVGAAPSRPADRPKV